MCRSGAAPPTCSDAVPVTPFADALIVASPVVTPVARPDAFTVAISIVLLDHVNASPGIALFDASNAFAVNCRVSPTATLAVAGATTMLAMAGGLASLHVPNVLGPSSQPFKALRASDDPVGSVPASEAPMSVDVIPFAGPFVAANVPSYERNSMTPVGL